MLIPLRNAIQVNNDINLKSSVQVDGDSVIHLKAVVDDKDLSAVIKPVVKPDVLSMTLNPSVDASLKITPHIQYSPVNSDDLNKSAAEPQGLPVHFVPAGDLSLFSKGLWDPNSTLKVSVQELNPQSEPQSKSQQSLSPQNATPTPNALTSDSVRPLDKIGDNLSTLSSLYKILGVLGNELQAPNGDSQSNLATLQQSQNLIHSTATNQDRTTVIEVRPNSVHSVVLQWFAAPAVPESCTLTFKVEEVNADKIHLSGITQKCSSQTSVIRNLPDNLVLGPGDPHNLGQWILSVDETRRRWAFLHAATLRFTWQPTYTNNGSTAQILRTSPYDMPP